MNLSFLILVLPHSSSCDLTNGSKGQNPERYETEASRGDPRQTSEAGSEGKDLIMWC